MIMAEFETRADALAHREKHGGWVFVTGYNECVLWFSTAFTPTTIFMHRATRGISGKLI